MTNYSHDSIVVLSIAPEVTIRRHDMMTIQGDVDDYVPGLQFCSQLQRFSSLMQISSSLAGQLDGFTKAFGAVIPFSCLSTSHDLTLRKSQNLSDHSKAIIVNDGLYDPALDTAMSPSPCSLQFFPQPVVALPPWDRVRMLEKFRTSNSLSLPTIDQICEVLNL